MNTDTTAFFCHGCKEKGNAISFTQAVLGVSPIEAIRLLKERYHQGYINPDAVSMVDEVKKVMEKKEEPEQIQPILDENILEATHVDWENLSPHDPRLQYMTERGFFIRTLVKWNIGHDPITNRITIPVRDEEGNLIGFKARALREEQKPRYLILGDKPNKPETYGFPCYLPSRVVFGAHSYHGKTVPSLIVCEGEFNAIAVRERAGLNAVAINGSNFTDHHARVIRSIASTAVLWMDDDEPGQQSTFGWVDNKGRYRPGIVQQLIGFMPVYITPSYEKDAARMEGHEIDNLLGKSQSALLNPKRRSAKIMQRKNTGK
jgi:DNA primase